MNNKSTHPSLELREVRGSRILRLTLNKEAFEITGTEEKPFELRNQSEWIDSRLYYPEKNGCRKAKKFDFVLLINGYSNKDPWKLYDYESFEIITKPDSFIFSNGLIFQVKHGDYKIHLGQLVCF